MRSLTKFWTWGPIAGLLLCAAACSPDGTSGSAALRLQFEGPGPAGATRGVLTGVVQSIRVTVSSGTSILQDALFDYDDLQGVVADIPAGSNRTFQVEALWVNTVVYRGVTAGVTIRAGEQAQVTVVLEPAYTEDVYAPGQVTDLAAQQVGGNVQVTWTAVGNDGLVGQAASTDLRWSEATIQAANFESANTVGGVPAPAAAGAAEQFSVLGLTPGRTYHFAVRAVDAAGNRGQVSNEAIVTLGGGDTTPPAAIADLAVSAVDRSSITLSWTAPGDDGASGQVAQYDVRYSTAAIDAANFGSALSFPGPASPVAGGQAQTLRIDGLTLGQEYHFAVKAADEVPNWSELSNVPAGTPQDSIPPAAVVLREGEVGDTTVTLEWTAPGEDGNVGTATSYNLRLSVAPIDELNFDQATAVPQVPAPQSAGSQESFTVLSLTPLTPYYFALRSADAAGNLSPLSNVLRSVPGVQDTTPPDAVADLAVVDAGEGSLTLEWTAPGDDGALGTVSAYDLRQAAAPITSEPEFDGATPVTWPAATALVSGGGTQSVVVDGLALGQTYHFAVKAVDNSDNTSALSNTDSGSPVDLSPPAAIADLQAEALGDTSVELTWSSPADNGPAGNAASYEIRYSLSAIDAQNFDQATLWPNSLVPAAAGQPEAEEIQPLPTLVLHYFAVVSIDAEGNRSLLSNPTSATPGLQDTVPPGAFTLALGGVTESEVTLSWTAPGDDGNVGTVASYDLRQSAAPITSDALFDAATPVAWPGGTPIVTAGDLQTVVIAGLTLGTTYHFAAKALDNADNPSALSNDLPATPADTVAPEAVTLAVSGATDSSLTLQWAAPHEDGAAGGAVDSYEVRWSLSPINAGNFAAATLVAGPPAPSTPGQLDSLVVPGLSLGALHYLALVSHDAAGNPSALSNVVTGTPGQQDATPPDSVANLTAAAVDEVSVQLSFTAPGDDGPSGTVSAYDVRYSDQPIPDDPAFAAATQYAWPGGTPIVAGGANQDVVVNGLTLGSSYYFALKARDNSGNWSLLSNDAAGAPADLVPPGAITDLHSAFLDVGQVDLEWTIPSEDGAAGGACVEYDLRYSATDITSDVEFGAAPRWTTGMPVPGAPGDSDLVSVTGLPAGTYYFCLKARDAAGNWSALTPAFSVAVP
ncbi:MAG TPA: fibronectin type III domain-containing protein [Myxococcota bacterium]|nr:fibronectin type III domain-containing protein [Myxococcota bacterium]HRY96968.1 fibronectin type III domain-containing protein [Myxococcota bacterium]HSA22532.1 fibronectin type III domain-containing protein [Myxococcota bacterium]